MPEIPVGAAILGSALLGGGASIFGSLSAGKAQRDAAQRATDLQRAMFEQSLGRADTLLNKSTENLSPFIEQGKSVIPTLQRLTTPGADMTSELEKTPGYQFSFTQGEKGITNQATSRGLGGQALREGSTFAAGLAQNTWSTVVDKLLSQLGTGKDAAATSGYLDVSSGNAGLGAATTVGGQLGQNITGAGNATAASDIGISNAVGGIGTNITNALMLNALTKGRLFNQSGTPGAWGRPDEGADTAQH